MNTKKYVTIVLAALLVFAAAFGGIYAARIMVKPFEAGQHGDAVHPVVGGKIRFLVVGTDRVAVNTDTILVASANLETGHISVMSVPRDTRVTVNGSTMKINAVYGYARAKGINDEELLIDTVTDVTGIDINYYAIINTEAFKDIVDTLGGVEYDVPRDYDYDDPYQDLHIHIKKGKQVLNGTDAEGLVRFRHDYARADLERVEVQQSFISELIKQKLNAKYITKIPKIYNKVSKNVVSNIKVDDIIDCAKALSKAESNPIETFTLPSSPKYINNTSYVIVDKEATAELVAEKF